MPKRLFSLTFALSLFLSVATAQTNATPSILPKPTKIEMGNSNSLFQLDRDTKIVCKFNGNDVKYAIQELDRLTVEIFGRKLKKTSKIKEYNHIIIRRDDSIKDEGYVLDINPENIIIKASTAAGVFYAVQTLKQIVPVQAYETPLDLERIQLPTMKVTDTPHFPYRGFMLDCSRHFWDVETVKEVIDILAMHKMNRFHWHLTEDQGWRIEIKKYPLLTKIGSLREQTTTGHNEGLDGIPYGGYYTQKEIKEVVEYARQRFVTIVPEIEIPGHSLGALSAYPWLGCEGEKGNYKTWAYWGVSKQIACAGRESTFKFWEDVLTEVIDLFPGEYIHIGGDEAPRDMWKECPDCQKRIKENNLKNEAELQSYVNSRIEKFLNSHGRKLIGWDEILEGGVSQDATIMSWRGTEGGIAAAKKGNTVIMTPGAYCYLDYRQTTDRKDELDSNGSYVPLRKTYSFDPYDQLTEDEYKYIMGVQGNLWTEYVTTPMQLQYKALPRLGAIAEIGWSNPDPATKDVEEFIGRAKELARYYNVFGWSFGRHFYEDGVQVGW
ncbi:MAG: beta-N-acetylhexosaminidase [Bacteroidaceae bacterium]|nr:beta-N-acetylhexosaminidase [Bacteroidaceae bacterium]